MVTPPPNGVFDIPEQIEGDDESDFNKSIIEICGHGLTIVVSDFNHLLTETINDGSLSSAIVVKVNHPSEIKIPSGIGVIHLGGLEEVNTNKPAKLEKVNNMLEERRKDIISRLSNLGMSVVEVIYNPKKAAGWDVDKMDDDLATSIKAYAQSSH